MSKENVCFERLKNGIVTENPTFVQMLGMCPTLAVTTSAINGVGMGLTTMVILTLSNFMISILRKLIPDKVRIPAYIVVIASFVTVVQFVLQAYLPELNKALGLYIPLIVVNCIILGRAEAYASKNKPLPSIMDGVGMGLGFTIGLTVMGSIREILGAGSIFGYEFLEKLNNFINENASQGVKDFMESQGLFEPIGIFVFAPGAFIVLAFVVAFINHRNIKKAAKTGDKAKLLEVHDCASCELECAKRTEPMKKTSPGMQSLNDELDKLEKTVEEMKDLEKKGASAVADSAASKAESEVKQA